MTPSKKFNFTSDMIKTEDGAEMKSPNDIAYHFNNFFCNIGQSQASQFQINAKGDGSLKYLKNKISELLFLAPTYAQEVNRQIFSLQNSSTSGHGDISSCFLKTTSETLSFIFIALFFNLFNEYECRIFPDILEMISIKKSGAKNEVNNYRPISLLPVNSNVFEKL